MIIGKYQGCLIDMAKSGQFFGIAHGANCQNVMKSGIAPRLCESWPQLRAADLETVKGSRLKLGTYSMAYSNENKLHLFNLYTQFTWTGRKQGKRDLDYKALSECFYWLNEHYAWESAQQDKPLGIPMIGAGLAGGDWDAIEQIINLNTPKLNIEVMFLQ